MIRIAVFDDDKSSIKQLDSVFEFYAVNRNTEYDVSWFIGIEGLKRIEKYASNLHMFHGFKYFGNLLIFDTRQLLYIIPVEEVAYFQSDLKYVNIVCRNGSTISIYKKLDEIESSLSSTFLRTHKSYIVNKAYIEKIDKTNRLVVLISGENLPISNSQYFKVLENLSPKI